MLFYGRVRELLELLSGRDDDPPLDRAALQLATIEYPGLDPEPFLTMLDAHAVELAHRLGEHSDGVEFVAAANQYLFEELRFRGNQENYYDPRNSCLNDVLVTRLGIPITLSLVYLEIARRLAKPVRGIGLPGHFLVEYRDAAFSTYLDPFHGGRLLTAAECFQLAGQTTGGSVPQEPGLLAPVSHRQILLRMIANLRGIYYRRGAFGKLLELLGLLLRATPDAAEQYKERGLVHVRLKHMSAAKSDLEKYLSLAPDAADRAEIEQHLRAIHRHLAGMN